jgi:hypothetical protein
MLELFDATLSFLSMSWNSLPGFSVKLWTFLGTASESYGEMTTRNTS